MPPEDELSIGVKMNWRAGRKLEGWGSFLAVVL